jgi:3-oxoacyl-[acyl-carrier-protein] synthase I
LRPVYIASDNIITSMGFTTEENIASILAGQTGIKQCEDVTLSPSSIWTSLVDRDRLAKISSDFNIPIELTRFEQLVVFSVKDAMLKTPLDISNPRTLFILSSTKGNIDILDRKINPQFDISRTYLWSTSQLLKRIFHLYHEPLVVSNACISGLLAIMIGGRLIRSGQFDHVIATGADLVTEFVLSGFGSFRSISQEPCKPFDKNRHGLSLGEGAGTMILTADQNLLNSKPVIMLGPGFSSNDANHISGPSRTGEGLYISIKRTLEKTDRKVDFISAHGTATPFNDEMEAIAISRAGLQDIPVNSLKGYWGHTLGAAGVIEAVAGVYSLRNNLLFKTLGFSEPGVNHPIAVISETRKCEISTYLKIASGFGGCNASQLFYK